jgi:hypothetical protein
VGCHMREVVKEENYSLPLFLMETLRLASSPDVDRSVAGQRAGNLLSVPLGALQV